MGKKKNFEDAIHDSADVAEKPESVLLERIARQVAVLVVKQHRYLQAQEEKKRR